MDGFGWWLVVVFSGVICSMLCFYWNNVGLGCKKSKVDNSRMFVELAFLEGENCCWQSNFLFTFTIIVKLFICQYISFTK